MNWIGAAFTVVAVLLTLALPRRYAGVPLLLSVAYMTSEQVLHIAGVHFTVPRILIAIALLRALTTRSGFAGGVQGVDWLAFCWAAVLLGTSAFHSDAWVYRSGMVWTELGTYLLFRIYARSLDDVWRVFKVVSVALLPLALLMLSEKSSGLNPFSVLGGVDATSMIREGRIRASGPFSHPILAGTVGAACIAIGLSLRRKSRIFALAGCVTGLSIVYACGSSGPIAMVFFILLASWTWPLRNHMRLVRALLASVIVALALVMKAPIYFLMARVDIMEGSQGWYRAQLIDSAREHLSEWWLVGTDYTRHWMATGILADERHTDMTNHFLTMGVLGGLPLMIVFILIIATSFRNAGRALQQRADAPVHERRFIWMLGALLVGFVMNGFAITLFDHSVIFFWMTIAAVASIRGEFRRSEKTAKDPLHRTPGPSAHAVPIAMRPATLERPQ
jgi:hypothetical protein